MMTNTQKIAELKTARTILEKYKLSGKEIDALIRTLSVEAVKEIDMEVADLQARINSIHLVEIPKDASDEIKEAINYKNGMLIATDIAPIQNRLEQKQLLLSEITNG